MFDQKITTRFGSEDIGTLSLLILSVILFGMLFIGSPVSALTQNYDVSIEQAQGYGQSVGAEAGTFSQNMNVTLVNIQNLKGLTFVMQTSVNNAFNYSATSTDLASWSSPASLIYNSNEISNGTVYFNYQTQNADPYYAGQYVSYQVIYESNNNNFGLLTGTISPKLNVTNPKYSWVRSGYFYGTFPASVYGFRGSTTTIPVSTTGAYIVSVGQPLSYLGANIFAINSSSASSSWSYKFKNSVTIINSSSSNYNLSVQRINIDPSYVGASQVWAIGGTTSLLSGVYGLNNVNAYGSSVPLNVTIKDLVTNNVWSNYFFAPTFNYYASPASMSVNQLGTGTISSNNGDTSGIIFYKVTDVTPGTTRPYLFNDISNCQLNFLRFSNGTWFGYNITTGYSKNLGLTIPNSQPLKFYESGNRTLKIEIVDSLNIPYTLYAYITVNSGFNNPSSAFIAAVDGKTSGLISGATINIYNLNTVTWTNATAPTGGVTYNGNKNDVINAYASANGYNPNSLLGAVLNDIDYTILLNPKNGTINSTIYLQSLVTDAQNRAALSDALITIENSSIATGAGYTNPSGYHEFLIADPGFPVLLKVTTSKTNYYTATQYTTVNGTMGEVFITLQRKQTGPTPTYTVPTSATLQPTGIIPTGTGGTYTGFWSPIANTFDAMGASPSLIGLLIGLLIIFIGFAVGGWSASPYSQQPQFNFAGSLSGGALGFVFAAAFGMIPFVWVIVVIAIGIFIVVLFR